MLDVVDAMIYLRKIHTEHVGRGEVAVRSKKDMGPISVCRQGDQFLGQKWVVVTPKAGGEAVL